MMAIFRLSYHFHMYDTRSRTAFRRVESVTLRLENVTIHTPRLVLRSIRPEDEAAIQKWASDIEIARTTLNIPHPYPSGTAAAWIERTLEAARDGRMLTLVLTPQPDCPVDATPGQVLGTLSLGLQSEHARGELGYWLGRPYWGHGLMTEAAIGLLRLAFTSLSLNRVFAFAFATNPASIRVLEKSGLRLEGVMRQHVNKWGVFQDLHVFGCLRDEWLLWQQGKDNRRAVVIDLSGRG
jgi:ribosomal-protein-alanine N-acetyltransferase